ncbi:hypothetical protein AB2S56_005915 [Haloparvum sp. AD34]
MVLDRVAEFAREYPDLADLPLSRTHGRKLRRIVTQADYEQQFSTPEKPTESAFAVDSLDSRTAATWVDAVQAFLSAHVEYDGMLARFADKETGDEFDVPLVDAWGEEYSRKQYARARALQRQMSGGERPSGGEAVPAWDDPATLMITLTGSSLPDGDRLPPVDHLDELQDAFSYGGVRDALRNTMEYHIGLDSDQWGFWLQGEPHGMGAAAAEDKEPGLNACYTHLHVGVYFEGAEIDDLRDVASSAERVVDKHLEVCDPAGWDAHDYESIDDYLLEDEGCISLNADVENLGSYLATYMGGYTEDLVEKPIEYIAWGAIYWASARRRTSRSQTVNQAIRADRCHQRAEYEDSGQSEHHAERVAWDDGHGEDVVCAECGSPWSVDQGRLEEPSEMEQAFEPDLLWAVRAAQIPPEESESRDLDERWPSAESGGSIGETHRKTLIRERVNSYLELHSEVSVPSILAHLNIDPSYQSFVGGIVNGQQSSDADGFNRRTRYEFGYELKAIVDSDGEEHQPGGGGVDMVALHMPAQKIEQETRLQHTREPGEMFRCGRCDFATPESETMASHLVGEGFEDPEIADRILIVEDYHDRDRKCMAHPESD